MKPSILILIMLLVQTVIYSQNPAFRVDKISQTQSYDARMVVTEKKFEYLGGKLNVITITEDQKEYDVLTYVYKKEDIHVNSKRREGEFNTYILKEGVLKSYKSNKANTFTFERTGNRISVVTHEDKCNQITYSYHFNYNDKGKISIVNVLNKAAGEKPISIYKLFYDDNEKLQRVEQAVNSGNLIVATYVFEYAGNNISKVTFTRNDKFDKRYEFDYDENGNVVEQREFERVNEKEIQPLTIKIAYSKTAANDSLVWSVFDWEYNFLFGIRTYVELPTPCY